MKDQIAQYPTYVINDASWGNSDDPFIVTDKILVDRSATCNVKPWTVKSVRGKEQLSVIYEDVNKAKAARLRNCATSLLFGLYRNAEGKECLKLESANFCRVRLCPQCSWRRSEKIYYQVSAIMNGLKADNYVYLFATFTVRNCSGAELPQTMDDMFAAWNRLAGYKQFKAAVKGWYRALEITHNMNKQSASFDTYHPHFHCIFAVNQSYFTNSDYLSHDNWLELWQRAARLNYRPYVRIQKVYGNTAKAVAEIAKYTVKDDDYIDTDDMKLSVETVKILDAALDRRRLVGFGGVMKEMHERLKMDDAVDGDLIDVGDNPEDDGYADTGIKQQYIWCPGYKQYRRIVPRA